MKLVQLILFFLFLGIHIQAYTQEEQPERTTSQQEVYSDRITDEDGNPMNGVKVQVQGKSTTSYSNYNGEFSIRAKLGDVLVLSKDGNRINSYQLDGSQDYRLEYLDNEPKAKNSYSKSRSKRTSYLDSARFYLNRDSYKSIDFIEQELKSNKRQNKQNLVESYSLLGDNYMQLKQYDLATSNYQTALKSSSSNGLSLKLAKALAKAKQYMESNQVYREVLKKEPSSWQMVEIQEGLGKNASNQNNLKTALSYFQEALSIAEKHKITPKISSLNAQIASLLADEGKITESNTYIQNTLETSSSEHLQKRAKVQNKVAATFQKNKDFDNEIQIRKKTLDELEEAQMERIVFDSDDEEKTAEISTPQLNLEIGRAYIDKNEYDKAIPYLEKSVSKANELHNLEIQKNAVQKLSELYKKVGNSRKALQNYQEYARLVDALYQQKEGEIQAAVSLTSELRAKQNRINSLEIDRELSESRYQLTQSEQELTASNYRRQQMLIYGLAIGLILFSIALFYMYRSNKQRRLANNLLALKSLRSQMNPHFIFNALNSVNSFIAENDERSANRYLTEFSTLMRNVLNNSEEDFIPLSKEIELLKLYIQLEHARFKDKFDYTINIDENIQIEAFQIPPMLLQPYVENAVWHGLRYKKTKGKLVVDFQQFDHETIRISITDDGIGRKKSKELKTQNQKKRQSKGMNNIKKRINILNEMYADKVDVSINDLEEDASGTRVVLTLKKD